MPTKSIVTKRGDDGFTDRLFGGKARKDGLLIEAIGAIDELNAAIGFATKAPGTLEYLVRRINAIQQNLVLIMGELSAGVEHAKKYNDQFASINSGHVDRIEQDVHDLEEGRSFHDWTTPSSRWDVACRVCRRAEREVLRLHFNEEPVRETVRIYLNRLSDFLWILGRT